MKNNNREPREYRYIVLKNGVLGKKYKNWMSKYNWYVWGFTMDEGLTMVSSDNPNWANEEWMTDKSQRAEADKILTRLSTEV